MKTVYAVVNYDYDSYDLDTIHMTREAAEQWIAQIPSLSGWSVDEYVLMEPGDKPETITWYQHVYRQSLEVHTEYAYRMGADIKPVSVAEVGNGFVVSGTDKELVEQEFERLRIGWDAFYEKTASLRLDYNRRFIDSRDGSKWMLWGVERNGDKARVSLGEFRGRKRKKMSTEHFNRFFTKDFSY